MPRVAALILFAALLALPATAQLPTNPSASLTLGGLPATVNANETAAILRVPVTLQMDNLACVGPGPFAFTVQLSTMVDGNATDATATVDPTLTFTVPGGLTTIQGYSQTVDATLVVRHVHNAGDAATFGGMLMAKLPAGGCTSVATVPGAQAQGNFTVRFTSPPDVVPANKSQSQPGVGLGVLAVAVVAVALLLRRRA